MKVCTDACVLGAWADIEVGTRLLDIGTGTGLLALMAAQRNPQAQIDAVELDKTAAVQAAQNVVTSPFAGQVCVWQTAIQTYLAPESGTSAEAGGRNAASPASGQNVPRPVYDHILTNPPFFTNSLRSPDRALNRALHTDTLPFTELLVAVCRLLKTTGTWWVLLPPAESDRLIQLAARPIRVGTHPLLPVRQLQLRHNEKKPVFRHLTAFGFAQNPADVLPEQLSIYEMDGRTYTADYQTLLRPYYLIF